MSADGDAPLGLCNAMVTRTVDGALFVRTLIPAADGTPVRCEQASIGSRSVRVYRAGDVIMAALTAGDTGAWRTTTYCRAHLDLLDHGYPVHAYAYLPPDRGLTPTPRQG